MKPNNNNYDYPGNVLQMPAMSLDSAIEQQMKQRKLSVEKMLENEKMLGNEAFLTKKIFDNLLNQGFSREEAIKLMKQNS